MIDGGGLKLQKAKRRCRWTSAFILSAIDLKNLFRLKYFT